MNQEQATEYLNRMGEELVEEEHILGILEHELKVRRQAFERRKAEYAEQLRQSCVKTGA